MEAEREIKRDEMPVCRMCRAAMHKHCERQDGKFCNCDCERGY